MTVSRNMKIGDRYYPNKAGDVRPCSVCKVDITVTEQMIKKRAYRCKPCISKIAQRDTPSNVSRLIN